MPKKWAAENFTDQPPRPHIQPTVSEHLRSCGLQYAYQCTHKESGSRGYGYTAEHAYARWLKNWTRRRNWYGTKEEAEERFRVHMLEIDAERAAAKVIRGHFAERDRMRRAPEGFTPVNEDES